MTELRAHKLDDLNIRLCQLEAELRRVGMDTESILVTETMSELRHLRTELTKRQEGQEAQREGMAAGRMDSKWS